MADNNELPNNLTPEELAKHFRKPEGEIGRKIGMDMNLGNRQIILNSYSLINPEPGDSILEIGMGNGLFVNTLFNMSDSLNYTGADFSPVMVEEANRINKHLVDEGKVNFECASIDMLPFADNSFDCIVTTNTLYFWPQPEENSKELLRILKPGGRLIIAYRSIEFIENIEFTIYGFRKFSTEEVESFLTDAGFVKVKTELIKEPAFEFEGNMIEMEGFFTLGIKK